MLLNDILEVILGIASYVSAVTFEANGDMEEYVGKDREAVNLTPTSEFDNEIIDALAESELALPFIENNRQILYQRIHTFTVQVANMAFPVGLLLYEVLRFDLDVAVVFHETS